ncbi:hypothetical protein ABTE19_22675, partial [Acinetobacter baumannii]
ANAIPTFDTQADAVEGFAHLARFSRAQSELMATPPLVPEDGLDDARVRAIIADALKAGREVLSEHEGKAMIEAYGIPVAT